MWIPATRLPPATTAIGSSSSASTASLIVAPSLTSSSCKETDMTQTEPQFKPGDRFFTHYDMKWGTVVKINTTYRDQTHGVTGSKLPDTTWYDVCYDDNAPKIGAPWCTCDN